MKKLVVRGLSALLAFYIAFLPLAVVVALMSWGKPYDENVLIASLNDILCEGNLIFISMSAAAVCRIFNLMGIVPSFQYRMNALPDWSFVSLALCAMGALFLVCWIRVKLAVFSLLLNKKAIVFLDKKAVGKKGLILRTVDAALTMSGVFLSNILAYFVRKTESPLFWAAAAIIVCLIFILAQNYAVKRTWVGEDGYFGSLLRAGKTALDGVQETISTTIFVGFLACCAGTLWSGLGSVSLVLVAFAFFVGMYASVVSMADDVSPLEKYGSLAVAWALFAVMSSAAQI